MWGDFYLTRSLATFIYIWVIQFFVKVSSYNPNKMMPVSVVEVCTTKFFRKTWSLLKKSIAMNPENYRVNNFCLNCLYFSFILLLHFSIFIAMNIKWSKQPHYTWSCLWNLYFVVCFCYFWKDFKLIYFWIPRSNSSMEGDEGAFLVKLQTENRCFCLR